MLIMGHASFNTSRSRQIGHALKLELYPNTSGECRYGVATIRRLLKVKGFFRRI